MSVEVRPMSTDEVFRLRPDSDQESGAGTLVTERGNLPLDELDVRADITGLVARTVLRQGFRNPYDVPLEATYIFPLPPRAAVSAMRMEAADRVVEGELKERGAARQDYDAAIAAGQRASIAEEERPDVFTMRVGNILPGERVSVVLTLDGPLPYADDAATYRFPLVVAPRYIPGAPAGDPDVGAGTVSDTDAVPDASRITPPVLLPGFPNPVRLSIAVDIDPAGLPLGEVRSSLHNVAAEGGHVEIRPGERVDRDFILRLGYGAEQAAASALCLVPDGPADTSPALGTAATADGPATGPDPFGAGTFRLTVLPPADAVRPAPRDVVLLLDRSGSMAGWKMVAARRAAARIVDTLTDADRFAVLLFDHEVSGPAGLPTGLVTASDRHRFRTVEELARTDARGGTELLAPLSAGVDLLSDSTRERVLVLVTDGQVGNEDQIVAAMSDPLRRVRVHAVGVDQAVNAGFLGRLASLGRGRCELVESEDRLDEAMDRIHRRIGSPVVSGLRLDADGLDVVEDSAAPGRLPDLFPGAPVVVSGRYRGTPTGAVTVRGIRPDGEPWSTRVDATEATTAPSAAAVWARARLRDLEDRYVVDGGDALERRILTTSLRFGVLCRFTAFVAVDSRTVTDGGMPHQVTQPVELPAGWQPPGTGQTMAPMSAHRAMPAMMRLSAKGGFAPGGPPAPSAPGGPRPAPSGGAGGGRGSGTVPYGAAPRSGGTAANGSGTPVREEIAEELARLRAARPGTAAKRLRILGDLGSRLAVLVPRLPAATALPALVDRLNACDGDAPPRGTALDTLWRDAERVLAELAGEPDPPARSFWKRH